MELKARIVQATDFIVATPDGVLDLEKSRDLLKKITKTSEGHGEFHILIDFRTTDIKLSTVDRKYAGDYPTMEKPSREKRQYW